MINDKNRYLNEIHFGTSLFIALIYPTVCLHRTACEKDKWHNAGPIKYVFNVHEEFTNQSSA
jgi:hypothetical protein